MGGHGLYASIGEYMKFVRMWAERRGGPARPGSQGGNGRGGGFRRPSFGAARDAPILHRLLLHLLQHLNSPRP
jgi:hypothetical protein